MKTRLVTVTAGATLAASLLAGPAAAQVACTGGTAITGMDRVSAAAFNGLTSLLLAEGHGRDVRKVPSSTAPALASMCETGKPDTLSERRIDGAPSCDQMSKDGPLVTLGKVLPPGDLESRWIRTCLSGKYPDTARLPGNVAFTIDRMNEAPAFQTRNNAPGEEFAIHVQATRPDVWLGWVDDAARERLPALIQ